MQSTRSTAVRYRVSTHVNERKINVDVGEAELRERESGADVRPELVYEANTIREFVERAKEQGKAWACTEPDANSRQYHFFEAFREAVAMEEGVERRTCLLETTEEFKERVVALVMDVLDGKVQPMDLGGIAGGTKFVRDSILLKFAKDPELMMNRRRAFLYGQTQADHCRAGKACANELRVATRLFNQAYALGSSRVVVPIQVVVDWQGWTMVAMPVLPIGEGRSELVYGSSDGGKTVHNKIREVSELMLKFTQKHR